MPFGERLGEPNVLVWREWIRLVAGLALIVFGGCFLFMCCYLVFSLVVGPGRDSIGEQVVAVVVLGGLCAAIIIPYCRHKRRKRLVEEKLEAAVQSIVDQVKAAKLRNFERGINAYDCVVERNRTNQAAVDPRQKAAMEEILDANQQFNNCTPDRSDVNLMPMPMVG